MLSGAEHSSLVETDTISDLPDDVKEIILTCLPVKEAGRTSVLSSKWRYTWTKIPELTFGHTRNDRNLVNTVNAVLLLHSGPIRKFNLSTSGYYPKDFDRWIVNLSRNGIRELTLGIGNRRPSYKMHSRFFACNELNYISLSNCSLKLPDQFKGFKLLHTLIVEHLAVSQGEIEKLISNCPLLKKLKLGMESITTGKVALDIRAHNLLNLEIDGGFIDLQIRAPKLLYLCLQVHMTHVSRNFEQILGDLPDLESFKLGTQIEYFCVEPLREGFSLTLNRLKNLTISLDFEEEKEAVFALALFQAAPHINVYLPDSTLPVVRFWKAVDKMEDLFKHLQMVRINVYGVLFSGLSFVEFMLGSTPQLVTLTIQVPADYGCQGIVAVL